MKTVYLAGPITGLSFGGCTDWREAAKKDLLYAHIIGLSPMRAKDYLAGLPSISGTGEEYAHMGALSLPRGVTTRDRFDTQRADVVLVNLLGAKAVSIGTMIELGWADSVRTPIVCAIEAKGNPHEHMMVNEIVGFRVTTLEDALHIVKSILTP
jgi:nucleoside 2-deoxyribosyltransferase